MTLLAYRVLENDAALMGHPADLFRFPVTVPDNSVLRVSVQGGLYLNWPSPSVNCSLRFDLGQRVQFVNPPVIGVPASTVPPVGTSATGIVQFNSLLPDITEIPMGTMFQRGDMQTSVISESAIEVANGIALVPCRATSPGTIGNCEGGTIFQWNRMGQISIGAAYGDGFTGGGAGSVAPTALIYRAGAPVTFEDRAGSSLTEIRVQVTDTSTRSATPGFPMPEAPWMAMGSTQGASVPGAMRWPWLCIVEQIGVMTP